VTRIPAWRIGLLRFGYGLIAAGLGVTIIPRLIWLPTDWVWSSAVVTCFLTAMMTMCALGVLRPLRMLPVMLFELIWKFVFMFRIAAPAWSGGTLSPEFAGVFWECVPILLFVPIIPWTYVWRKFGPRAAAA
jgi:hypothetical protein